MRPRDAHNDPHRAVERGAMEGADFEDLLFIVRRGDVPVVLAVDQHAGEEVRASAVSVPAMGPSDLSERYVTALEVRSWVSRSSDLDPKCGIYSSGTVESGTAKRVYGPTAQEV